MQCQQGLHGLTLLFTSTVLAAMIHLCSSTDLPTHIFSGARIEEIPTVIPYTASVPLLYKMPYHTTITQSIPKSDFASGNCDNVLRDDMDNCQHKKQLKQLQNFIHEMFILDRDNFNPAHRINQGRADRKRRAVDFIGETFQWCCNVATLTNLKDLSKNEAQVDDKLNDLLDYVKDEHQQFVLAEDKLNNFSLGMNDVFKQLHEKLANYDTNLSRDLNQTSHHIESLMLKYTEETWLYIYLSLYYNQLQHIEEDCQNNKIPENLLPASELRQDLLQLQEKLRFRSLDIAIPIHRINFIYSLPISQCHFENESIILEIRIPVRKLQSSYRVFKYEPIPLLWQDKVCELATDDFIVIKENRANYIVDTKNNPHCEYMKSNLCHIPRFRANSSVASTCARYLLNGTNLSQMKTFCEFHCYARPDLPVVTQLAVNKFLITNVDSTAHIFCKNTSNTRQLDRILVGTMELHLPCDCQLLQGEDVIIDSVELCDSRDLPSPIAVHLIPLPWTNLDQLKIDPIDDLDRPEFHDVAKFITDDWMIRTPTFEVDKKTPVNLFKHVKLGENWTDVVDDRRIILYVLLTITSLLILTTIVLFYKIHILHIQIKMMLPKRDFEMIQTS